MSNLIFSDFAGGRFYNADCFDAMQEMPDGCVDMILCDLPYGTTECKWDSVLPFDKLWAQYSRVIKDSGAIVLTAAMPFTATLVCSNLKMFRYSLVWDKVNKYTGSLNANRMPLRRHEDILVFYKKLPTYNKQFRSGKAFISTNNNGHGEHTNYGKGAELRTTVQDGQHHNPCSIVEIKADNKKELGLHPTQKPVELFEYLIKTYTNENDLVLDNCAGSGTTAVACKNLNRRWVCMEKETPYFEKALERL